MTGAQRGRLVGVVNVIVVALCQAIVVAAGAEVEWDYMADPGSPLDAFLVVAIYGFFPALAIGSLLGWCAERLDTWPIVRFTVLASPALVCVVMLGLATRWHALIVPAWGPTLVACWHLERATRTRHSLPQAILR